jgi:hypothetical protein
MTSVATRLKKGLCQWIQGDTFNSRNESMLWVMTMLKFNVARNAEIIIITCSASNKALFWKFFMSC